MASSHARLEILERNGSRLRSALVQHQHLVSTVGQNNIRKVKTVTLLLPILVRTPSGGPTRGRHPCPIRTFELPALENVTIAQLTAANFYRCIHSDPALQLVESTNTGPPNTPPPTQVSRFPALKTLICKRVDFQSTIPIDSFVDFLIMRYEMGGEIETLVLDGCVNLPVGDVKRLDKVVVDVEFYTDEPPCDECGASGCPYCDY
ncbi:hypothetical protein CC1G_14727 [Coprinopsis cinerea okayama7|uniref:F-box domain-containing protein n=1 Tax=Coprinopsis cinerea (strain Okayama-7 / 130 / ATCC MYA-4618 / FGSC 9003) TaxID=240176 RepID=D6RML8_COPC7|nr:hypothetical protein CC1G_14727 [Coprinopsis cinerea okayama7\|eukprot:XP_002911298.1 hypothetical protein CC1G_14727 [Coprinopsis cinerea okayama7\